MSYQQWTRFWTTLGLQSQVSLEWIKQSTSGKRHYELRFFLHSVKTIWGNFVHWRKNDLDLWPWNSLVFVRLSRTTFMQNFIQLSAAVNELSCVQRKKQLKTLLSIATTGSNNNTVILVNIHVQSDPKKWWHIVQRNIISSIFLVVSIIA